MDTDYLLKQYIKSKNSQAEEKIDLYINKIKEWGWVLFSCRLLNLFLKYQILKGKNKKRLIINGRKHLFNSYQQIRTNIELSKGRSHQSRYELWY